MLNIYWTSGWVSSTTRGAASRVGEGLSSFGRATADATGRVVDATREAGSKVVDVTREAGGKVVDVTKVF